MTNMQQLYATHLENVRHDREMERLQGEQNENTRKQIEEQGRHNLRSEELSQYQADVSSAASRYAAEKGAEGRIVSAQTSADASKYASNQSREAQKYSADTNAATQKYIADQNVELQSMLKTWENQNKLIIAKIDADVRTKGQAIESRKAWLDYLAKCGANQAALKQADAALKNADTNAMLAIADKQVKETQSKLNEMNAKYAEAQKKKVSSEVAKNYTDSFTKFGDFVLKALDAAKKLAGGTNE